MSIPCAATEPVEVRYVDVTGRVSAVPFACINVVVTRYADGTMTTAKIVR
ncbi:MAG: hypothetical protein IJ808_07135 [Muribaculaceae bacterium]|nr:hypothetical protein [Muribaculaceae bacterium]